jgi:hypothetical protein
MCPRRQLLRGYDPVQPPPVHVCEHVAPSVQSFEQPPPLHVRLQVAPAGHSFAQRPPSQPTLHVAPPLHSTLQAPPAHATLQVEPPRHVKAQELSGHSHVQVSPDLQTRPPPVPPVGVDTGRAVEVSGGRAHAMTNTTPIKLANLDITVTVSLTRRWPTEARERVLKAGRGLRNRL